MIDAIINLLILVVACKIAYDEGHFRGRRMVRDEWIRSLR
jgi:hypothetical protein